MLSDVTQLAPLVKASRPCSLLETNVNVRRHGYGLSFGIIPRNGKRILAGKICAVRAQAVLCACAHTHAAVWERGPSVSFIREQSYTRLFINLMINLLGIAKSIVTGGRFSDIGTTTLLSHAGADSLFVGVIL